MCTYTTMTPRGIGRDVEFRVHVLGVRRSVIADARWVPDLPSPQGRLLAI